MPVMDGLEAARELRRRGFKRIRLVALTADVTTETRAASVEAGIDEYLSKPLKLDALAAVLARATGVARRGQVTKTFRPVRRRTCGGRHVAAAASTSAVGGRKSDGNGLLVWHAERFDCR